MIFGVLIGHGDMAEVDDRGPAFDGIKIGRPATGALVDAGYASLRDLPADLDSLLKVHGVGPTAVARLTAARQEGRQGR